MPPKRPHRGVETSRAYINSAVNSDQKLGMADWFAHILYY